MTAPIEIGRSILDAMKLPVIPAETDKNSRGQVLVVGGGDRMLGATILAGLAALRVGAGKLQLAVPRAAVAAIGCAVPEAMAIPVTVSRNGDIAPSAAGQLADYIEGADAILVGPGMLDKDIAGSLAVALMTAKPQTPFLIDAAALTGLKATAKAKRLCTQRAVLTPHAGEMATLLGMSIETIRAKPLATALEAAAKFAAVVALKDGDTYITTPSGECWVNRGGVAGLATSGSGDVLAGMIGGLLARGASPVVAAIWGVFLHAEIGRRLSTELGPLGFLARDILDRIPRMLVESGTP
jgi:ADP-dependent NAD(P)H-hydrate dehydratase